MTSKDYPPESYDIKCMDDTWDYLKTENAVSKFESYIRGWMKQIQELLLESEQLRLETDDAGPQVIMISYTTQTLVRMITLVEHRCAQPRECSFLPKKLMSTNNLFIGLVLGCA